MMLAIPWADADGAHASDRATTSTAQRTTTRTLNREGQIKAGTPRNDVR